MKYDPKKVIAVALAEVGYQEKETNARLEEPYANPGDENFTKYARDLDAALFYNGKKNGFAWCDVFVDWCFFRAYGERAARKLTFQPKIPLLNRGAGCRYSMAYYEDHKRVFEAPMPGDQIFFHNAKRTGICHTGLVYDVDEDWVYTVEGNTSDQAGVVDDGGAVCKKKYGLDDPRIAGYGRPQYE